MRTKLEMYVIIIDTDQCIFQLICLYMISLDLRPNDVSCQERVINNSYNKFVDHYHYFYGALDRMIKNVRLQYIDMNYFVDMNIYYVLYVQFVPNN